MNNVLVLLNYNDFETVQSFLKLHKDNKFIDKIVVVDNCSTDGSYDQICLYDSEKIDVIKSNKNGGYAYGNNYGAFYAIKKYNPHFITIANPDVQVSEDNFNGIFRVFENKKNAALVSCIMEIPNNDEGLTAWKTVTYTTCLVACMFGVKRLFKNKIEYPKNYFAQGGEGIREVDVVAGSFFVVNAQIFSEVGGFDDGTFLYYEEAILSRRIKQHNYKLYIDCNSKYLHLHSVSVNKNIKTVAKRLDILQDSRIYYCNKYLETNKFQIALLKSVFCCFKWVYVVLKHFKRKG